MAVAQRPEIEADMRETLGLVPSFFSRTPHELLEHEWAIFKQLELGETLIPNKYRELMGVALHSETKCRCGLTPDAAYLRVGGAYSGGALGGGEGQGRVAGWVGGAVAPGVG